MHLKLALALLSIQEQPSTSDPPVSPPPGCWSYRLALPCPVYAALGIKARAFRGQARQALYPLSHFPQPGLGL